MAIAFQCSLLTSCLEVGNSGSNLYKTSCTVGVFWMLLRVLVSLTVFIFDRQIGLSYSCCVTHIAKIYLVYRVWNKSSLPSLEGILSRSSSRFGNGMSVVTLAVHLHSCM